MSLYDATLVNLTILILGCLICLVMVVALFINQDTKTRQGRLFMGLVLLTMMGSVFEGVAWALDAVPDEGIRRVCWVVNFCTFFCLGLAMVAYAAYIHTCISMKTETTKTSLNFVAIACAVYQVAVIASLFNGMIFSIDADNVYSDGPYYILSLLFPILTYIAECAAIFQNRRALGTKDVLVLSSYAVIPFVAVLIQMQYSWLMVAYVAYYISLVLIYMGYQAQQREKLMREMTDKRAAAMLSQIQPHFLYNSLSAIEHLTTQDSAQARRAVHEFAMYLRGNLDSLNQNDMIPFEQELGHIQHYVSLEKMRFREKLHIEFDIQVKNFEVPPLTVQPIVENAVRYGVGKKKAGGTVTIQTTEAGPYWCIVITDDGAGFDPAISKDDGRSHTGIENVRTRLAIVCNGTLEIDSRPDEGTKVTIRIPKGGDGK